MSVIYVMEHAKSSSAMKKIASTLKSFITEFQPFINEINIKEEAVSKYAGAAAMERISGMIQCYWI